MLGLGVSGPANFHVMYYWESAWFMEIPMKRTVILLLAEVMLLGVVFAQDNSTTPLYPTSPHPSQAPPSSQDAAPQDMNQNTGQNDIPVFRVNDQSGQLPAPRRGYHGGLSRD